MSDNLGVLEYVIVDVKRAMFDNFQIHIFWLYALSLERKTFCILRDWHGSWAIQSQVADIVQENPDWAVRPGFSKLFSAYCDRVEQNFPN